MFATPPPTILVDVPPPSVIFHNTTSNSLYPQRYNVSHNQFSLQCHLQNSLTQCPSLLLNIPLILVLTTPHPLLLSILCSHQLTSSSLDTMIKKEVVSAFFNSVAILFGIFQHLAKFGNHICSWIFIFIFIYTMLSYFSFCFHLWWASYASSLILNCHLLPI
jgi:hypothetical protein